MELFEKLKEFKEVDEKAQKLNGELKEFILSKFVKLRYEMQAVEACYSYEVSNERIKGYYPVLDLPEGFVKENETFIRNYANQVIHKYTLIDKQNQKVKIEEVACFESTIYDTKKGKMFLDFSIVSGVVEYKITISEVNYHFKRNFDYEEMIEQVVIGTTLNGVDYNERGGYNKVEKNYEEYLEALGKTGEITSLKDIVEYSQKEMQITPSLVAKFEINKKPGSELVWMKNSQFRIGIKVITIQYLVKVKVIIPGKTEHLSEKEYRYIELYDNKEMFENGMTLHEAIQLIKE